MRKIFIVLSLILLIPACASIHDIEKKKAEGDAIIEVYNYPLEEVFDAIQFVIRHSENFFVSPMTRVGVIDFNREDKIIIANIVSMGSIDMGIFLEPIEESKTKAYYVKGAFTGAAWRGTRIKEIIDESKYYVTNGETAYRKYTHEKEEKRKEEAYRK